MSKPFAEMNRLISYICHEFLVFFGRFLFPKKYVLDIGVYFHNKLFSHLNFLQRVYISFRSYQ